MQMLSTQPPYNSGMNLKYFYQPIIVLNILICTSTIASPKPIYKINGISAPIIPVNPAVKDLEQDLSQLRNKYQTRTTNLSLDKALELGLLNNPILSFQYSQIQEQEWRLVGARNSWYPTSGITNNTLQRFKEINTIRKTKPTLPDSDNKSSLLKNISEINEQRNLISLNLNWNFFDLSRAPTINADLDTLKSQQYLFNIAARNLVIEVQQIYYQLQKHKQLVKSYEKIAASLTRSVSAAESKFNSGIVPISDVLNLRTTQYLNINRLIVSYRELLNASARLSEKLALSSNIYILPSDELNTKLKWDKTLEQTIIESLSLREEIKQRLALASSSNWRAISFINSYFPKLSITANTNNDLSYTTNADTSRSSNSNQSTNSKNKGMLDINTWNQSVELNFVWNFFDGGINLSKSEVANANSRGELDRAEIEKLQVIREVTTSFNNYKTSEIQLRLSNENFRNATLASNAVTQRYEAGVTEVVSLVQAIEQEIIAATEYVNALAFYNESLAGLYRNSAVWPSGTKELLDERLDKLRGNN